MASVDPVGVALGLPGAVTSCAEIYRWILTHRRVAPEANQYVTLLALEQLKFHCWVENAGLLSETSDPWQKLRLPPLVQTMLIRILQDISTTLDSVSELIAKHELVENAKTSIFNFALPEKFWTRKGSDQHQGYTSDIERIKKVHKLSSKGLAWSVADKDNFKSMLETLKSLNEALDVISSKFHGSTFKSLPSMVLPKVLSPEGLESISIATREVYPELGICAAFKMEVLKIADEAEKPVSRRQSLAKAAQLLSVPIAVAQRYVAEFGSGNDKVNVLVEEKRYFREGGDQYEKFIQKRVDDVARLLAKEPKPAKFRVLDCVGYVHNRIASAYSLMFRHPAGTDRTESPVTLNERFASDSVPSLTERFALGRSLATSLLYLQACGIVHKALESKNVLIFKSEEGKKLAIEQPYISGFGYARFSGRGQVSEIIRATEQWSLASHPAYDFSDRQRYLKIFDIYSLGVLLMEIGFWRRIEEIAPREKDRTAQRKVLIGCLAELRSLVGDIFAEVVARCLTSDIEHEGFPQQVLEVKSEDGDDDKMQQAIVKNVVERLEQCKA